MQPKQVEEMCKGVAEDSNHSCSNRPESARSSIPCELCGIRASLYCQADDAFLCWKCDRRVHEANFLALRHSRRLLCGNCQNLTKRYLIGSSSFRLALSIVKKRKWCNSEGNHEYSRFSKKKTLTSV